MNTEGLEFIFMLVLLQHRFIMGSKRAVTAYEGPQYEFDQASDPAATRLYDLCS